MGEVYKDEQQPIVEQTIIPTPAKVIHREANNSMTDRARHPSQQMQSNPDREPSIMGSPLTSWRSSIPSPNNNNSAKPDWSPMSSVRSQTTTQASPMSLPGRASDQPDVWARLSGRLVIGKDCKARAGTRVVSADDHQAPSDTGLGTICEVLNEGLCTVQWDFEKTSARPPRVYSVGHRGVFHLELCLPEDEMTHSKYKPGNSHVLPPHRMSRVMTAQLQGPRPRYTLQEELEPSMKAWYCAGTLQNYRMPRKQAQKSVDRDEVHVYKRETQRQILWQLFIRFAQGTQRKRYHGYDPRSLEKQKVCVCMRVGLCGCIHECMYVSI
jgi:hypothetical protein